MNALGRIAAVCLSACSHSPTCYSELLAGVICINSSSPYTTLGPAAAALWQNLPMLPFWALLQVHWKHSFEELKVEVRKKWPKEVELTAFQSSLWTQPMVNKIVNPALRLPVCQCKCHGCAQVVVWNESCCLGVDSLWLSKFVQEVLRIMLAPQAWWRIRHHLQPAKRNKASANSIWRPWLIQRELLPHAQSCFWSNSFC